MAISSHLSTTDCGLKGTMALRQTRMNSLDVEHALPGLAWLDTNVAKHNQSKCLNAHNSANPAVAPMGSVIVDSMRVCAMQASLVVTAARISVLTRGVEMAANVQRDTSVVQLALLRLSVNVLLAGLGLRARSRSPQTHVYQDAVRQSPHAMPWQKPILIQVAEMAVPAALVVLAVGIAVVIGHRV